MKARGTVSVPAPTNYVELSGQQTVTVTGPDTSRW